MQCYLRINFHFSLRLFQMGKCLNVCVLVSQSCLTLCDPMEWARLLCSWNSLGKSTGVGSHSLLQGIFPTQGSNLGLPHCRRFFSIWATKEAHLVYSVTISCISLPPDSPLIWLCVTHTHTRTCTHIKVICQPKMSLNTVKLVCPPTRYIGISLFFLVSDNHLAGRG